MLLLEPESMSSQMHYTSEDVLATIAEAFEKGDMDAVYGYMPAHPSFYCRRAVYQKYGLFDTNFKVAADFEQLLRLIYIHNIKTKYINKDFVTMRTGGASTSGMKARRIIMKEHLRAFKKNGIRNIALRLSLLYVDKLMEYFISAPKAGK